MEPMQSILVICQAFFTFVFEQKRAGKPGVSSKLRVGVLDCGGKQSATPLWEETP
jgi:hypothetical protein